MWKEPRTKHKTFIVTTTWYMIDYKFTGVNISTFYGNKGKAWYFNEAKIISIILWFSISLWQIYWNIWYQSISLCTEEKKLLFLKTTVSSKKKKGVKAYNKINHSAVFFF